jgi:serine/threonine protein kinase
MTPDTTGRSNRSPEPLTPVEIALENTATHSALHTPVATATAIEIPPEVTGGPSTRVTQLGQYRLIRELGAGGMGIVFEAEDTLLNRRVALKVLRPNLPSEQSARERFLREARAMGSIDHPNVVSIYGVGEDNGIPYMAMQLLQGETLDLLLDRVKQLPVEDLARIGREVADGLAAAHASGLVHRDVKPSNIWIEAGTGKVKILDFGLALARDNIHLTNSGFVIGTPSYMSPEQARGEDLDGRSDLFSLGSILYQAATGERPFEGPTAMVVMRNLEMHYPARVNAKRTEVPSPLSNLIMEMLAKVPKDRPATAKIVTERLSSPQIVEPTRLPTAPPNSSVAPRLPRAVVDERRPWKSERSDDGPTVIKLLFYLVVVVLCAATVMYITASDRGNLLIETEAEGTEVEIRQRGAVLHISTIQREFSLPSGTYELVLVKPKMGYALSRNTIQISRNAREIIRVVREMNPK